MADVFSKKKRSEIMARIRAKNTGIEKAVFSYLRKQKIYFQKHYECIPGKPDIALPSKKIAIFINGDFWHGYRFPAWKKRIPKIYWRDKIASNIARDKRRYAMLRRRGWHILKVWEHEIEKRPEKAFKKIENFLKSK
jgi:DNA mismatch endonuclease (patch repair protein)